jgi:hypothetical protein
MPDTHLSMGPSLGNSAVWVTTKGTGTIERVFNARVGESLFGAVSVRYALVVGSHVTVQRDTNESSSIPLQGDAGTIEVHPAYQRRRFSLGKDLRVCETTFVPLGDTRSADGDAPVAYVMLEVTNGGLAAHTLRVSGFAAMRGSLPADVHARYHKAINALVASNGSNLRATRCFGLSGSVPSYETTTDFGRVYDPNRTEGLSNETVATGDILGCLQAEITLAPDATTTLAFVCATFADGELAAISAYETLPPAQRALDDTISYLQDVLGIAEVITPDKDINDGVLWSKVNMRRVMSRYAGSEAFTNEPGVSSNVVGRDAAWFVYGNDSFLPHFSRSLLNKFAEVQYPDGKIPEFYNALTDEREDRGLNINDDTPLFILAVNHHYRATGDIEWLRSIYPSVVLASTYIMSQVDERGLVFCSSRDPRGNVWAGAMLSTVIRSMEQSLKSMRNAPPLCGPPPTFPTISVMLGRMRGRLQLARLQLCMP